MGVLKNEMVLKWLEVSCMCFKWTVYIPNDVYVLEMTGTCWKWPVCIENDPNVLEMMRTYLKWCVCIGICWEWPVCIENDPDVLEMTCTYLKWPTRIGNDVCEACVFKMDGKWTVRTDETVESYWMVGNDLVEHDDAQTGATRSKWEIWDQKQMPGLYVPVIGLGLVIRVSDSD